MNERLIRRACKKLHVKPLTANVYGDLKTMVLQKSLTAPPDDRQMSALAARELAFLGNRLLWRPTQLGEKLIYLAEREFAEEGGIELESYREKQSDFSKMPGWKEETDSEGLVYRKWVKGRTTITFEPSQRRSWRVEYEGTRMGQSVIRSKSYSYPERAVAFALSL